MAMTIDVSVLLVCTALIAALALLVGRYIWPVVRGVEPAVLAATQAELLRTSQQRDLLETQLGEAKAEQKALADTARSYGEDVARLGERVTSLANMKAEQMKATTLLATQRDTAATEAIRASSEIARLTEREASLSQKLADQERQLANLQKQLTSEFENIANRILKANATELAGNSLKALAGVLDPLRERIVEFQQKIETSYAAETREVLSLKEQIKLMVETSTAIGSQADGLAKALRGDSQILGRWGELALERILESAGLKEGREYTTQGRGLGLKNESGGSQRPDVIIHLPERRTMIIDSKTPLAAYERLIAAKEESERSLCADGFVRDVKGHIEDLSGKRYQDNDKLQAHDCVLMFVPIEGALAAALTREPELFTYAWNRQVVLVGPPTLLMTLRTVASIWRYELQGLNAQEIARLAGDLCDKVSSSLSDLSGVGDKLSVALAAHNDALRRLASGKGNALTIGERIRGLGVKTKRPMPALLVDGVTLASDLEGVVDPGSATASDSQPSDDM
jgi:DNA recombination protein RmuC